ncbi:MAG: asparagine synthase (glutamine-hydrolyzing) [Candidatus Woykebacteria bacterium GWA1_44_8]|uniref:asparagine synthase (glutamine-hydrolyzing) n=1 Tax=Candidatus Woykebacteria bacterium GWA1_44_8 TaxID=1802591 RepID=A0A1G1W4R6_9BACT|nr:MAG: asparagine synthase (glutamine-hydrolyzing) [Candidatus Woykebacteria bacterium GWA1_44_8]
MLTAMQHRGPDDQGAWHNPTTALGAVRLAIIDPSAAGHQPMSNSAGNIWIAYNGEMYNFREEQDKLAQAGHQFQSNSDTEVVLKLYEIYGNDFLQRLRGIFALAIYDQRPGPNYQQLLLARDPLGIKPLLYHSGEQSLVFASEMKGLLAHTGIPRTINLRALAELLNYGSIPQPTTFLQGVHMLLPAHYLTYRDGKMALHKYWEFDRTLGADLEKLLYPELVSLLRNNLEAVVKSQLVSDVPVGAFLSGGVDSAALVALMAKVSPQPIKTFSIGFTEEGRNIDETARAEQIAQYIGTDHTRIQITGVEVREQLRQFVRALDQPSVDGLNSYLVAKAASPYLKVAISGLGGDELFAGYPWFNRLVNFATWQKSLLGQIVLTVIARLASWPIFDRFPPGQKFSRAINKLRGFSNITNKFLSENQIFSKIGVDQLLTPTNKDWLRQQPPGQLANSLLPTKEQPNATSVIQQTSLMTLQTYTQNQLLRDMDAVSMYQSLEVRVPYLDTQLLNLAINLPDYTKLGYRNFFFSRPATYRSSGNKRILIDAVRDLLPPDIDQQTKLGFSLPLEYWLKTDLQPIMNELLSPEIVAKRGLFRPQVIQNLRTDFMNNRVSWTAVWLPMIIELWCQEILDTTN